jgi:hypothetical protein
MISAVVQSATESELSYIASLDYGQDAQRHLEALKAVLFEQHGLFRDGQAWYPYEVVELGSHSLAKGHEREFAICTLLVIEAVRTGFDSGTDLVEKLGERAADYDALPIALREDILSAYSAAEC